MSNIIINNFDTKFVLSSKKARKSFLLSGSIVSLPIILMIFYIISRINQMSEIGFVIYIIIFLIYIFLYYITLIDLSKNLKSLLLIESFRIFPDKIEVKKADGITKIFYKCTYHDYRKNRFIIHLIEGTDKYLIDSKLFDEVSEP